MPTGVRDSREGIPLTAHVQPVRSEASSQRRAWRLGLRVFVLSIVVLPLVLLRGFFFHNNFGVMEAGRAYRSAQPKTELDSAITDLGLATVVNLRGGSRNDWWYVNEVETCAQRGVDFYDLPMSAEKRPSRRELLTLLELFETCRYPILIHCKSGSDRTGLAAALYALYERGLSPERSRGAFSIWYGHVPLFGPERLHEPLREYAAWLDAHALIHTPARFRRWVERDYRCDDPDDEPLVLRTGPRAVLAKEREPSASVAR